LLAPDGPIILRHKQQELGRGERASSAHRFGCVGTTTGREACDHTVDISSRAVLAPLGLGVHATNDDLDPNNGA